MSCPPRLDPALHLPPGIFHTRHIAGDQSLRNKRCTFPPVNIPTPETIKKRWTPDKNSRAATLILSQFTVLFQCALERTHPSIHLAQFLILVVTTESHTWSLQLKKNTSEWKERRRRRRLMRRDLCGIGLTPRDASETQKTRNARWRVSDRDFSLSLQGTSVKFAGFKTKLPAPSNTIKAFLNMSFHSRSKGSEIIEIIEK